MSSNAFRIAYFGLPLGALALASRGVAPVLIVLGHTDAVGARRVRRVLGRRALVLARPDLDAPEVQAVIASARPDALISWFYPKQIPAAVLALAPRGAFGAHPSLLPRWRGPDPYFWALHAGDPETGVTLHRLDASYDTGALVEHVALPIADDDDAWRLARKLDRPGLSLITRCAVRLAAGELLEGVPQDEALATEAPAPDEETLSIDWHDQAAPILRLVRAAAPNPGASAELGDALVEVLGAELYARPLPRALEPADAVWTPEGLVVRAADAGVRITAVRTEDGELLRGDALAQLFAAPLARVHFDGGSRKTTG